MTSLIRMSLIALLMVAAAGCSSLLQEPQVRVKSASLIGIDTAGADIELYLGVTNPNSYDIHLLGYTYDLRIMTLPIANGGHQEQVRFSAGQETDLRFPIRIPHGSLIELLKRRPDPDRIPYRLEASLNLASPLGDMKIPIERNDTIAIPRKYHPGDALERVFNLLRNP